MGVKIGTLFTEDIRNIRLVPVSLKESKLLRGHAFTFKGG